MEANENIKSSLSLESMPNLIRRPSLRLRVQVILENELLMFARFNCINQTLSKTLDTSTPDDQRVVECLLGPFYICPGRE